MNGYSRSLKKHKSLGDEAIPILCKVPPHKIHDVVIKILLQNVKNVPGIVCEKSGILKISRNFVSSEKWEP